MDGIQMRCILCIDIDLEVTGVGIDAAAGCLDAEGRARVQALGGQVAGEADGLVVSFTNVAAAMVAAVQLPPRSPSTGVPRRSASASRPGTSASWASASAVPPWPKRVSCRRRPGRDGSW